MSITINIDVSYDEDKRQMFAKLNGNWDEEFDIGDDVEIIITSSQKLKDGLRLLTALRFMPDPGVEKKKAGQPQTNPFTFFDDYFVFQMSAFDGTLCKAKKRVPDWVFPDGVESLSWKVDIFIIDPGRRLMAKIPEDGKVGIPDYVIKIQ